MAPRRSARLRCLLLQLGRDEMTGGLVVCLSTNDAFALMQTCRSMFGNVLRALIDARLSVWTDLYRRIQWTTVHGRSLRNQAIDFLLSQWTIAAHRVLECLKAYRRQMAQLDLHSFTSSYVYTRRQKTHYSSMIAFARGFCTVNVVTDQVMHNSEKILMLFAGRRNGYVPVNPQVEVAFP